MVTLSLEPDQAIGEAELRLKAGNADAEDLTIPLEIGGDGRLTAEVPITTDHSLYRVHLVGEESGFTNKHSPDYEIRAVPTSPRNCRSPSRPTTSRSATTLPSS